MNSKELKKILALAREYQVTRIKTADIELELHLKVGEVAKRQKATPPGIDIESHPESKMPSDDEMLLYSTPSFDQLQKDRAEN